VIILPDMNLALNFKPENKTYRFIKGKSIEVSELVAKYLKEKYPNSFKKILPVINTVNNTMDCEENNVVEKKEHDVNILDQLIEIENRSGNKNLEEENLKNIIKKAIGLNIIAKQGTKYKVGEKICKGLPNLKKYLEGKKEVVDSIIKKF